VSIKLIKNLEENEASRQDKIAEFTLEYAKMFLHTNITQDKYQIKFDIFQTDFDGLPPQLRGALFHK
jgi:hypothetical protein